MRETITATLECRTRATLDLDDIIALYDEGLGEHYMGLFYDNPMHLQAAISTFEDVLGHFSALPTDARQDDAIAYWRTQVMAMLTEACEDLCAVS